MPLKDRLVYAREQSGYTKPKHAAEKAGITPSALYQLESGATKSLSGATAQKLGAVYPGFRIESVSYTHLDVYKRQAPALH